MENTEAPSSLSWRGFHPLLLGLLLVALCCTTALAERNIAVLYPNVNEPYLSVFQTIIQGIQSAKEVRAVPIPVSDIVDPAEFDRLGFPHKFDGVIALGRQGLIAIREQNLTKPAVIGALTFVPEGYSGVSLNPAPEILFKNLVNLAPAVKKIHVVYDPKENDWLIESAHKEASKLGLQLHALPARSLREAVLVYRDILKDFQKKTDAIWLPLDNTTTSDDIVLPMLLEAAWEKDILLFSSKPTHAQRGALFSMFPDQYGMGRQLAQMALTASARDRMRVAPLLSMRLAVNLRTAAHLGLRFTSEQQQEFDLVFPSSQ